MPRGDAKASFPHRSELTREQVELENRLYEGLFRNCGGGLKLEAVAAAAVIHLLLLGLAIPSLPARHAPPEIVTAGPGLQQPPVRVPPPRRPPAPVERLVGRQRRALIPTPEPVDVLEPLHSAEVDLPDSEDLFDIPPEFLDAPPEPPPSNITIFNLWDPDIVPPSLIQESRVEPAYPPLARLAKVQGRVVLQAVIRQDGTVGEIEVLDEPEEQLGFAAAAVEAVGQWRYIPAMQRGRPVDLLFTIVIEFKLR